MFSDLRTAYPSFIVLLLLLLLGSYYMFAPSMDSYPSYVHAWTQSDRLALAMNFQENGFDFFHPATYNLLTKDGITQVDFPIHDYLVATLSHIFSSDIISTFRWYNLVYSLIGFIFFFRLALGMGMSGKRAAFATVFLFTTPFFVYYINGFLPSTPSFANLIIGLYFFQRYLKSNSTQQLIYAFIFLGIAALARAPFFIYLLAACLTLAVRQFKQKKFKLSELLPAIFSIGIFYSYWLYNRSLGDIYGSMFLLEFRSPESLAELLQIIRAALARWSDQLLSPFHALLLIFVLGHYLYHKARERRIRSSNLLSNWWLISFAGVVLFFFIMAKQFVDHDYYYIDTFLPLLAILWLQSLTALKLHGKAYTSFAVISLVFSAYFFSYAKDSQANRYTPPWNDRINYAYTIYKQSISDLKSWGLKPEDTLTVLEANSTNIPFTLLKNKGHTSLNSLEDSVVSILKKPSDYVLLVDSFFRLDTYRDFPNLIYQLKRVNGNGLLSLYRIAGHQDASLFFKTLHHHSFIDFDQHYPDTANFNYNYQIKSAEGSQVMDINPQTEYNLTFEKEINIDNTTDDLEVFVLADYFQTNDTSKFQLVCDFGKHYYTHYTENTLTEIGTWTNKLYRFKIPKEKLEANQSIKIYFWNQSKKHLLVDNIYLTIYQ